MFISSKTIKKANPYVKKTVKILNSGNSIAPKVLIATSVIDCGVSINIEKCPEVTNIVISQPEKTEFLQMLGRIRLNKNSNQINLFIRYLPVSQINSLNNSLGVKIEFLKNFYLLNRTVSYPKGIPTETYDGMGEKNILSEKKVEKIIKAFLKTDRGNILVRRKKRIIEDKRVDGKQILYEYDISKTAVIHLAYVLWQYNQVLKNEDETDLLSHLKYQLSWIGKEYVENNWFNYSKNRSEFLEYLNEVFEKGYFNKNEEKFSEICLSYIFDFPSVFLPRQLRKDRFRYESGERKSPSRKKLNETFEYLRIPFVIEKKRFYTPEKITKWKLVRKQKDTE